MDKIAFYAYKYAPETARATFNGQPVNIEGTAAPLQICTGSTAGAGLFITPETKKGTRKHGYY